MSAPSFGGILSDIIFACSPEALSMASATTPSLRVAGLRKHEVAEVKAQAKQLGVTLEEYLRDIVQDRLAVAREARAKTFAQLAAPMRRDFERSGMTEADLDALVERARTR